MKQKLLKQTFLVLALLGAGITNAWAAPAESNVLKTMTGRVGLTDNTSAAFTYGSKVITLAANETYVMTFVNHNAGSGKKWNNWILEGNNGTYYFDFRADGGYWGSLFDNNLATANYNGKTHSDVSGVSTDVDDTWMAAYNGVTVTLTATRSADGSTLTFTHSATTNNSVAYSGTFTVSLTDASSTINFYITNEASYQDITSVVYTNASGEVTHYELKDVDLSKFDNYGSGSYSEGTATITISNKAWSKLDLSSYYSSIEGTITNVNIKFTENIQNDQNSRMALGIYGDTKSTWNNNAYQDTDNSVTAWGLTGSSGTTRIYHTNASTYATGVTLGAATEIEVDMDIINKTFTWIQAGTTKVNNQSFIDTSISTPQYFGLYAWAGTSYPNSTTLTGMTLEIVYLETTYYTATFTNTASGNTVSATIYTDSERETEISNGMLENGTKYYFTATEAGYEDYNGDFTVSGSDPSVSFEMTAKALVTSIRVDYKVGDDVVASEAGDATGLYVGESAVIPYRMYVANEGKLYMASAQSGNPYYGISTTLTANTVVDITVTEQDLNGGTIEFIKDLDGDTNENANIRASYCGAYNNRAYTSTETLSSGIYTFIVRAQNKGRGSSIKVGDVTVCGIADIYGSNGVWYDKTFTNVVITTEGQLTLAAGSNNSIDCYDIIIAIRTNDCAVNKSISSAGWATYCSPYALDFSGTISGLTNAYFVTGASGTTLTLSEISGTIPANTGILLEGSEGSITIPVVASSSTDVSSNKLEGVLEATIKDAESIYVLLNGENGVGFYKNNNNFTVGANTAYLPADFAAGARLFYNFYDDTTGLNVIDNGQWTIDNSQVYDLQGRRVNGQLKKGLYIINGKKVAIK